MADVPVVNGKMPDWGVISSFIDGELLINVKEIKYESEMDGLEAQYGHGRKSIGETDGIEKHAGSIIFWRPGFDYLVERIKAAGHKGGISTFRFPLYVNYGYGGTDYADELVGVRIKKIEGGGSQGPDGLEVPCELFISRIKWNGVELVEEEGTA